VTPLPLRLALGQAPLRAQLSPNCLRNGNGTPLQGSYTGTGYEGGYRHSWRAPGIRIEYVFVD
jgi:hypothetical protein